MTADPNTKHIKPESRRSIPKKKKIIFDVTVMQQFMFLNEKLTLRKKHCTLRKVELSLTF